MDWDGMLFFVSAGVVDSVSKSYTNLVALDTRKNRSARECDEILQQGLRHIAQLYLRTREEGRTPS